MRVAIAQINSVLGDFHVNRVTTLEFVKKAVERRCDLVVFPEASLFGYHPVDLLERPNVVEQQLKELHKLAGQIPKGIGVIVGAIVPNPKKVGKPYLNAAVLLQKGKKPKSFAKTLLPTYDVFDEARHIEPGDLSRNIFRFKGKRILVSICEDIWAWPTDRHASAPTYPFNPIKKIESKNVDLVVNLSASPFTDSKIANRHRVTGEVVKHLKAPMVYVNMVGAQDELIFDGGSFALSKKAEIISQCVHFDQDLNVVDFDQGVGGTRDCDRNINELRRKALVLGIRDFSRKVGVPRVHLGLSGGVDSAVVACLAVDALGPQNVTCIALPGPYSSPDSLAWAKQLAEVLGVEWADIAIDPIYQLSMDSVESSLGKAPFGLVNENLQARIRGMLLMAYSNKVGSLLLNTSNKSEMAVGYSTLYGDSIGALCPIADLLKTQVYDLARHYNQQGEIIPKEIIERPPSAELRPDQKDEDTLPPYKKLDPVIEKIVIGYGAPRGALEKRVLKMMMASEFKRWQAPPILKLSDHAFGRGRRLPVAHRAFW